MDQNRIAWITGGGTGIGLGAARALVATGWTVVISGRRSETLNQAVAELGGGVEAEPVDVGDAADVERAAAAILARHGRIDLLVNSAGVNVVGRDFAHLSVADWDKVIDINLNGVLYATRAVLPAMRAQGGGTIINVASWVSRFASRLAGPAYVASKTAVLALTQAVNLEEFSHGVRACAFCPGEVATPLLDKRPVPVSDADKARMLQIDDCGSAIAYVANSPMHVCFNEILVSPTWNRGAL